MGIGEKTQKPARSQAVWNDGDFGKEGKLESVSQHNLSGSEGEGLPRPGCVSFPDKARLF